VKVSFAYDMERFAFSELFDRLLDEQRRFRTFYLPPADILCAMEKSF
jgi:hypothetical protein